MLVLVRVDDRLIHAQVVIGWKEECRPDRIILADDNVAANEFEKNLYISAASADTKVSVIPLKDAAERIKRGVYDRDRVILLVRSPEQALRLYEYGVVFDELNIGGMHYMEGRKKVMEDFYISDEEKSILRELVKKSVVLEARALPGDEKVIINSKIV
ncbi:MAG TPA: PTS sugar transporter subunit IIB [Candidatus Krumholzibacteriaceae bacterium]|nr:PTS sugar transporter subunit IIB [Candidatus Krumholzibacteriaceae bacterium]